jgi:hypothetical protein
MDSQNVIVLEAPRLFAAPAARRGLRRAVAGL